MLKSKVGRSVVKRVLGKTSRRKVGELGANVSAIEKQPAGFLPPSGKDVPFFAKVNEALQNGGAIKSASGADLTDKVRELLIIAKEQGHLTSDDIDDALVDCA